MQRLRHARLLVRLVLTWFVLALGVAVAAPLVQPQSMEWVCSSGSAMKLVVTSDAGTAPKAVHHTLDCPLCATLGAPPPALPQWAHVPEGRTTVLLPGTTAPRASRAAAPPPARGPPHTA